MKKLTPALIGLLIVVLIQACGKYPGDKGIARIGSATTAGSTGTTTSGSTGTTSMASASLMATYAYLYTNVFQPKCVSCHSGGAPSGNYDLSSYATTISGGHVVSFSPTTSPLYLRVNDNSMPQGGVPLTTAEKQAIYTWIANGAMNN